VLKQELGLDAELRVGPSGSFEVAVDGRTVVKKESLAFPTEREVVDAVAREVGGSPRPAGP
jgi:selenoprotein W-related protein